MTFIGPFNCFFYETDVQCIHDSHDRAPLRKGRPWLQIYFLYTATFSLQNNLATLRKLFKLNCIRISHHYRKRNMIVIVIKIEKTPSGRRLEALDLHSDLLLFPRMHGVEG